MFKCKKFFLKNLEILCLKIMYLQEKTQDIYRIKGIHFHYLNKDIFRHCNIRNLLEKNPLHLLEKKTPPEVRDFKSDISYKKKSCPIMA